MCSASQAVSFSFISTLSTMLVIPTAEGTRSSALSSSVRSDMVITRSPLKPIRESRVPCSVSIGRSFYLMTWSILILSIMEEPIPARQQTSAWNFLSAITTYLPLRGQGPQHLLVTELFRAEQRNQDRSAIQQETEGH